MVGQGCFRAEKSQTDENRRSHILIHSCSFVLAVCGVAVWTSQRFELLKFQNEENETQKS